ncbi:MAG TPA: tetratricopeptide repeat protein [Terriglobales bacterium]|nr:tetratricopeptide repeat protein [Terriglobales bacterium]
MRRALLALLAVAALATPTLAGPREDALFALDDRDDTVGRRVAVRTLMQAGTMADVPRLVQALRDSDAVVRVLAEQALWEVWSRSGNQEIGRLFEAGTHALTQGRWDDAIALFSTIIDRDPAFAEGWNKRATAYYLKGEYRKSLADCDEVIKRNPYHYGALSGYGMIYVQLDQPVRAIEYFEKALAVNPNMDGVRDTVDTLKQIVIRQRKDAI